MRPRAILTGWLGFIFRRPSPVQSAAKSGARTKISPALTDWNHVAGTSLKLSTHFMYPRGLSTPIASTAAAAITPNRENAASLYAPLLFDRAVPMVQPMVAAAPTRIMAAETGKPVEPKKSLHQPGRATARAVFSSGKTFRLYSASPNHIQNKPLKPTK